MKWLLWKTSTKFAERYAPIGEVRLFGFSRFGVVSALESPDVLYVEAFEECECAAVVCGDLGDAVAVVGHCEFTAQFKPFL